MRKYIHLGMCCLLATMITNTSQPPCRIQAETPIESSKDGRTGRILSSVGEVVEGLVRLIKNPHEKTNVLQNVGKMLAGILNVAANAVQKGAPLTADEVEQMRMVFDQLGESIEDAIRNTVTQNARSMHNYLRAVSIDELEALLNRSEEETDEIVVSLDEDDQELQTGILHSLHEMLHDLFAIIHSPEDPQLIGQSIADILASIMNVASQALKYEYLTSKDAEENVALYLDSFSTELTKEIKHLMLQTALHLRGESTEVTRSSCNNKSCCKTSCCKKECKPCC
ncbi:MAG: hypothetical protein WD055_02265, partial [Candidatus Dependentiae bacterium]